MRNKSNLITGLVVALIIVVVLIFVIHKNSIRSVSTAAQNTETSPSNASSTMGNPIVVSMAPGSVFEHGNFSINFPGNPTLTTQSHTDEGKTYVEYNYTYADPSGFGGYTVDYVQFPFSMPTSEELLRTVTSAHVNDINLNYVPKVTGKIGLIDGAVSTSTFASSTAQESLTYRIDGHQTDVHGQGMNIMVNKEWKMYQIEVIYHGKKPADVERFINSFQMK